jgi:hypothetical protein
MVCVVLLAVVACGKGKGNGGGGDATTEARLQLDSIAGKAKKGFYKDGSAFPTGDGVLAPATPCCKQPDHVCAPMPSDWGGAPWDGLSFGITDRPYHFQYGYQSDGKTFTATAVGDPACDGHPVTLIAHGSVVGGEPSVVVEQR